MSIRNNGTHTTLAYVGELSILLEDSDRKIFRISIRPGRQLFPHDYHSKWQSRTAFLSLISLQHCQPHRILTSLTSQSF